MKLFIFAILISVASILGAQTRRLIPSDKPCDDAFANAMRASFEIGNEFPPKSHERNYFINRGFIFGDIALSMYMGDHSQDNKLCTKQNLLKLESINTVLDVPVVSWDQHQQKVADVQIQQFDSNELVILAEKAQKYLKSKF